VAWNSEYYIGITVGGPDDKAVWRMQDPTAGINGSKLLMLPCHTNHPVIKE
jgi:hypothetical protein